MSTHTPSSPSSQPPGTLRLLALRAFDNATAADLVRWATDALAGGWDSPALRILAGLDVGNLPSVWEAKPYLESSLAELGIALPDAESVVRQYVDEVALGIASGRLAPRDAVETIHLVAITPLTHPADLQPWCDLGDGLDPWTRTPVDEAQLDDEIRAYAKEWLRTRGPEPTGAA